MNITRELTIGENTQTLNYELTGIELERCYNEKVDHLIQNLLYEVLDDKEYEDASNIPSELMDEMKEKFRKEIEDALKMTMENVVERYENRLEPYKEKWKIFRKHVSVTLGYDYYVKAKNESDADDIFDNWSERHSAQMERDVTEDMWNADWETDDAEEEYSDDPDNYPDVIEEDD